ncbi:hypothetical protein IE81DRAFT_322680 [Ceraceosorus guamensis]|uniref:Membrane anchor Opy2 N-terminal domain-containing protein n=1 Tax=Ceraceosorus guamensis TaxID=1522189 RepID=A0A316W064_9BASI|nr:hypothetical protein IE81DRAFT_322680 [Ceraceosorus guamensis]PWN43170.1 hypothetical protein IE81DRAFT_322680 [Ceraceosorus guamensis]
MSRRRGTPTLDLPPSLAKRACASCPTDIKCPVCPKGQTCQQIFRSAKDCSSCPSNVCVADPNYQAPESGSKAGPIGGAVGGVIGAFALAAVLFWFWLARKRKARAEAARARMDAKVRAAEAEKFRPGGNKRGSASSAGATSSEHLSSRLHGTEEGEDEDEEDVEYTELRSDGLTTYRKPATGSGAEEVLVDDTLDVMGYNGVKRRSTGAATHLSRITEGAEEEEEMARRSRALSSRNGFGGANSRHRSLGSTSSINLDPYGGIVQSGSGGRNLLQAGSISSAAANPFSDSASVTSDGSGSTKIIPIMFSGQKQQRQSMSPASTAHRNMSGSAPLKAPEPAHRAPGAPLIDLKSGSAPKRGSSVSSPQATSPGGSVVLRGSYFGSGAQSASPSAGPPRPTRDSELNLRLPDGSEPGMRKSSRTSAGTAASSALMHSAQGEHFTTLMSPAAPSTAHSQQFDFRRTDPAEHDNFPEELQKSAVYARKYADRHLSTATSNTASSSGTSGLDYVLSTPKIMTPVSAAAPKRVIVGQGKAQLVRSLSQRRREAKEAGERTDASPTATPGSEASDPFADARASATAESVERIHQEGAVGAAQGERSDSRLSYGTFGGDARAKKSIGPQSSTDIEDDLSHGDSSTRAPSAASAFTSDDGASGWRKYEAPPLPTSGPSHTAYASGAPTTGSQWTQSSAPGGGFESAAPTTGTQWTQWTQSSPDGSAPPTMDDIRPVSTMSFGLPFVDSAGRGVREPQGNSPRDAGGDAEDRKSYWTFDGNRDSRAMSSTSGRPDSSFSAAPSGAGGLLAKRAVAASAASRPASSATTALRQSTASSIGGLSVFDGIPFVHSNSAGEEEVGEQPALPEDFAGNIARAQAADVGSRDELEVANPRSASRTASARNGVRNVDEVEEEEEQDEDEDEDSLEAAVIMDRSPMLAAKKVYAGKPELRSASSKTSLKSQSSAKSKDGASLSAPAQPKIVNMGANTDFESLRLQHELAQYPFATYSPPGKDG